MNLTEWVNANEPRFGSPYETLFARTVLPLVPELKLDAISVQYPFRDSDRRQRYCDFVIHEDDSVTIAIEIDGYDKRGTGEGMSHAEFIDWQRRHAALTSQGWYVLRFANKDVRDDPARCAEHISLLLRRSRTRAFGQALTSEETLRLESLTKQQEEHIRVLTKDSSAMKFAIASFSALVLVLVLLLMWQAGGNGRHEALASAAATVSSPAPSPNLIVQSPPLTADAPIAKSRRTTSCPEPLAWDEAREHVGESHAIVGPVVRVTRREDIKGKPTWVDVGAIYPDPKRVVLVVWGDEASNFPVLGQSGLAGKNVCVLGKIQSYKGVSQVELKERAQLTVLWQ